MYGLFPSPQFYPFYCSNVGVAKRLNQVNVPARSSIVLQDQWVKGHPSLLLLTMIAALGSSYELCMEQEFANDQRFLTFLFVRLSS